MDDENKFEFVGLSVTERILAFTAPLPMGIVVAMLLLVFGKCAHFRQDKYAVVAWFATAFRWIVIVIIAVHLIILYLLLLGLISVASPVEGDGAPNPFLFGVVALISGITAMCAMCLCGGIRLGPNEDDDKEKKRSRNSRDSRVGGYRDRGRDRDRERGRDRYDDDEDDRRHRRENAHRERREHNHHHHDEREMSVEIQSRN